MLGIYCVSVLAFYITWRPWTHCFLFDNCVAIQPKNINKRNLTNFKTTFLLSKMKSQEHTDGRHINKNNNNKGKMLMLHLMQYFASAVRWVPCRAMSECHVQLAPNTLIGIQTLNLWITNTRNYPIEPVTNLSWSLIHMFETSIDKHTA